MNLTEWAVLPEKRQHEMIAHWYSDSSLQEYQRLALDAAKSLQKELMPVADVTSVEPGAGEKACIEGTNGQVCELVLNVCTLLFGTQLLEQIPPRFAGFTVKQVNLGDRREAYLRTWKRLFSELNGWGEDKTVMWAERWADDLKRITSPLHSWGPVKVAIPSLVDPNITRPMGAKAEALYSDIRDVICNIEGGRFGAILHPDTVESYDWEYARRRLEELVEEHRKAQ